MQSCYLVNNSEEILENYTIMDEVRGGVVLPEPPKGLWGATFWVGTGTLESMRLVACESGASSLLYHCFANAKEGRTATIKLGFGTESLGGLLQFAGHPGVGGDLMELQSYLGQVQLR